MALPAECIGSHATIEDFSPEVKSLLGWTQKQDRESDLGSLNKATFLNRSNKAVSSRQEIV